MRFRLDPSTEKGMGSVDPNSSIRDQGMYSASYMSCSERMG